MRACGDEIHVGLHGKACRRQNALFTKRLAAREASRFNEPKPLFDATGLRAVAVVIEDTFAPGQTERGIFAARQDGGVFDRDAALVVVAVQGPRLKLPARELALVHHQMKRMLVMVAFFADGMEAGDKFGFRKQRAVRFGGSSGHSSNSIPS